MKRALFLLLLLSFILNAQEKGVLLISDLDEYVYNNLERWGIPGLSLGIVKNDSIVFKKSYGVSNITTKDKIKGSTLFPLASVTKHFTALALLNELQKRGISFDESIYSYLRIEGFEKHHSNITFKKILSHQLPYASHHGDFLLFHSNFNQEVIIKKAFSYHIEEKQSQRSNYNNVGYVIAQKLLENITGKSLDEYLYSNFFKPLEMFNTMTSFEKVKAYNDKILTYASAGDSIKETSYIDSDVFKGAGGIYTTMDDFVIWMKYLLSDSERIIDSSLKKTFLQPLVFEKEGVHPYTEIGDLNYGYGLRHQKYNSVDVFRHSGGLPGLTTLMILIPEQDTGVFFIYNKDNSGFYVTFLYELLDSFFNLPFRNYSSSLRDYYRKYEGVKTVSNDSFNINKNEFADYFGSYFNDIYGKSTIFEEGNDLKVKFEHHPELEGKLVSFKENELIFDLSANLLSRVVVLQNKNGLEFNFKGEGTSYFFKKIE